MMILNERQYIEDLINGEHPEVKSAVKKIGYLARYFNQVKNLDDESNYTLIVDWMTKNQDNFEESCYSNVISQAIKRSNKYPLYYIDNLVITKPELDTINSLNNLREEKIAFVLLCMAKQQSQSIGFTNGLVKYSLVDLCKAARVVVPADDREYILYSLLQKGLISCPKKNNTECLIVNFISDGELVIKINEIDCQELAYVYLNWKNNGGYDHCKKCDRLFKHQKNKVYCIECTKKYNIQNENERICDCGNKFTVEPKNNRQSRCTECQCKVNKKNKSERNRRYYESHKN